MAEQRDHDDPFPACDICGRTMLKGEQLHEYVTPQRDRIRVCVLCRSRAESEGWIPVSMAHTLEEEQPRSRGLAIRDRFSRAASRARSAAKSRIEVQREREEEPPPREAELSVPDESPAPAQEPPRTEAAAEPAPRPELTPSPAEEPSSPPRRAAKPRAGRQTRARTAKRSGKRPAERDTATPRRSRAKRGPEALMRRAVERFNSSEERRKVAGLIRSLGEPQAGVRPDPRRQLALVTVAWELSWYQWEVGADGEGDEPVREIAKGAELSELDDEARAWNAVVDEDGMIRLRSAAERQPQEAAKEA